MSETIILSSKELLLCALPGHDGTIGECEAVIQGSHRLAAAAYVLDRQMFPLHKLKED